MEMASWANVLKGGPPRRVVSSVTLAKPAASILDLGGPSKGSEEDLSVLRSK